MPQSPLRGLPRAERLRARTVTNEQGCWLWQGPKKATGYGLFGIYEEGRSRVVSAHRWSYEHFVGPIPAGMELDHVCRNRECVNPDHLEPVSHAENVRRSREARDLLDRCGRGHDLTEPGSYYQRQGWRNCRRCSLEGMRAPAECPTCGRTVQSGNLRRHRREVHAEVSS